MKNKIYCVLLLLSWCMALGAQTTGGTGHSMLVADYDYVCRTTDRDNQPADVAYGLTLQVGRDVACCMGRLRHEGKDDSAEQLLYVPTTWQNWPKGKVTSVEAIPPYQYVTTEKTAQAKWALQAERDTVCGYVCQKAVGQYGGREWMVWFAESLPSRFGPWRLGGLPGLILKAASTDGIHRFECVRVEAASEAIAFAVPEEAVRCARGKFVKLRNRTFCNPNYVSSPTYYIKPAELSHVTVMRSIVIFGNVPIDMKPAVFQPLDY